MFLSDLTNSCLVDLIDTTLACEDANSKLVEVVTVADVDAGKRVDDSLMFSVTLGPDSPNLHRHPKNAPNCPCSKNLVVMLVFD